MPSNFASQLGPGLLAIALVLPLLVTGPQQRYALDTAIQMLTYIMLGWGLNVVVGLAGLLDLGYVAFYAVGAYSYALIATTLRLVVLGLPAARGPVRRAVGRHARLSGAAPRGDYLAIVTLAFGEIIRIVLLNWQSLTNGPNGISRIPKPSFFGLSFDRLGDNTFHGFFGLEYGTIHRIIFMYYLILVLALLVNFVTKRLRRLPIGRAWEALREDEIACRSLGINTVTTKLTAFAIGAMFGGFAGSFFATRQGFISPESFTFHESALVLADRRARRPRQPDRRRHRRRRADRLVGIFPRPAGLPDADLRRARWSRSWSGGRAGSSPRARPASRSRSASPSRAISSGKARDERRTTAPSCKSIT